MINFLGLYYISLINSFKLRYVLLSYCYSINSFLTLLCLSKLMFFFFHSLPSLVSIALKLFSYFIAFIVVSFTHILNSTFFMSFSTSFFLSCKSSFFLQIFFYIFSLSQSSILSFSILS